MIFDKQFFFREHHDTVDIMAEITKKGVIQISIEIASFLDLKKSFWDHKWWKTWERESSMESRA